MLRPAEHVRWIDRAYGVLLLVAHIPLIPLFLRLDEPLYLFVVLPSGMTIIGILLLLRIPLVWSMFCAFAIISMIIAPFVAIFGLVVMVAIDSQGGFRMFAVSIALCVLYAIGFILATRYLLRKKECGRLHAQSLVRQ